MQEKKLKRRSSQRYVTRTETVISDYLREIVYGGSDGIVTTFAVVAGFTGANVAGGDSTGLMVSAVVLFGFANLFADAMSMGLGDYLSMRAEEDMYHSLKDGEMSRIESKDTALEKMTLADLKRRGFDHDDARMVMKIFKKNAHFWAEWIMHQEHKLPDPGEVNPFFAGVATFVSFLIFGFIPLAPFLVFDASPNEAFFISLASMLLALFLLGMLRWRTVGQKFWRSMMETVVVGSVSAGVAFLVGVIIK